MIPNTLSRPATWRRRTQALSVAVAIGGLVLASQVLPAEAATTTGTAAPELRLPPEGRSWLQGVVTDQAGHPLNNVNVEVWPTDVAATAPVASNLSYAGIPADGAHQKGVFRVEVPAGASYEITVSTVGGQEDADKFRMLKVGGGAPIQARGAIAVKAVAGRTINLGKVQLARQGRVGSSVKVTKPRKVTAGKRVKLAVRVHSKYVTHPTGKVRVNVGHKTVVRKLGNRAGGKTNIRLPLLKPGKQVIKVSYLGSKTVSRSKSKPIKVQVKGG